MEVLDGSNDSAMQFGSLLQMTKKMPHLSIEGEGRVRRIWGIGHDKL